jgi:hypothetical protein
MIWGTGAIVFTRVNRKTKRKSVSVPSLYLPQIPPALLWGGPWANNSLNPGVRKLILPLQVKAFIS